MTPAPSRLGFLDDRVNPIVVKELRQAVKSWFIVGLLLLLLAVLTLILLLWVMSGTDLGSTSSDQGRRLFLVFQGTLLAVTLLGLPVYTGVRLAAERASATSDLLYVTTIKPRSIVWGKLAAGVAVTLLVFAACAPFMIVTYLLRGIDPPTILFVLGLDFLLVLSGLVLAIFVGALPVGIGMKVFLGLIAVGTLVWAYGITTGFVAFELVGSGVISGLWDPDFLVGLIVTLAVWGAGLLLLLLLVVAMIAPDAADRARPLRTFVTLAWAAGGALATAVAWGQADGGFLVVWLLCSGLVLLPALLVASSERDAFGPRQRRSVPRRPLPRAFSALFSSGAAAGLVWATLLMGLTILLTYVLAPSLDPRGFDAEEAGHLATGAGVCTLYVLGYCLLACVFRRLFLKNPRKQAATGAVAAVLMAAGMLLPPLLAFAVDPRGWDRSEAGWLILNPFAAVVRDGPEALVPYDLVVLGVSSGLVLVGLALNARWILAQWKRYAPLDPGAPGGGSAVAP